MGSIEHQGGNLSFDVRGAGDAVVLIPGLGMPRTDWGDLPEELAREFQVLTLDNRGSGESQPPARDCSIGLLAGDLVAVMDAAGLDRAAIIGVSMGGHVAIELALQAPSRVRALVLAQTLDHSSPMTKLRLGMWRELARVSTELVAREILLWIQSEAFFHEPATAHAWESTIARNLAGSLGGFLGQAEACIHFDRRADVHRIACPTLIVAGGADHCLPLPLQRELAARLPQARFEVFEGEAHCLSPTADTQYRTLLQDFLRQTREPPLPA